VLGMRLGDLDRVSSTVVVCLKGARDEHRVPVSGDFWPLNATYVREERGLGAPEEPVWVALRRGQGRPLGYATLGSAVGGGGIGPMAGPAYDRDPAKASPPAWPAYFDGVPLFYEWTRDYIKEFRLDAAGNLAEIRPATESLLETVGPANGDQETLDNGMDIEFGPEGALYTLEYGDGFFSENPDAQLARIDCIGPGGNHAPRVQVSANPTTGLPRLTVSFSSAGTSDPDGDQLSYAWYLDDNDDVDSTAPNPTFTYKKDGVYQATLKVTDEHGRSASSYVEITVGNQPPVVELTTTPAPGQPFAFGQTVTFNVNVTDEAAPDCSQVQVHFIVGHDDHGHPISTTAGCTGAITTIVPEGHDPGDITAVFVAEYTDPGGLIGDDQVVLRPTG
jgi:cytochrome c